MTAHHQPASTHAASVVVAVSLATSASAHVEAGGLLPGAPGIPVLLLSCTLLWLIATHTARGVLGLVGNFSLGQWVCHVAYSVGTLDPKGATRMDAHVGQHCHARAGHHLDSAPTGHHMEAGMGPAQSMGDMQTGWHVSGAMFLAHCAAVVVGVALVLTLRRLPVAIQHWRRRMAIAVPSAIHPTPVFRAVMVAGPVPVQVVWVPPPLRRGPPQPCW